jgi:hypothetical protein
VAGHRLTTAAGVDDDALAAYVADLGARLRGPRRRRTAILTELTDGLHQAAQVHRAAGQTPERAAATAIARFGTPQAVADAFAGELATAYARRTIIGFIATGPLVGIWWLLLLHPSPWRYGFVALLAALPVLPLIALAILTAGGTVATTGRLMRWLPETGPHRALGAVMAIAALCLIGDLTVITRLLASGAPIRPLAVLAIAASLTRIACSVIAVIHATGMRNRASAASCGR